MEQEKLIKINSKLNDIDKKTEEEYSERDIMYSSTVSVFIFLSGMYIYDLSSHFEMHIFPPSKDSGLSGGLLLLGFLLMSFSLSILTLKNNAIKEIKNKSLLCGVILFFVIIFGLEGYLYLKKIYMADSITTLSTILENATIVNKIKVFSSMLTMFSILLIPLFVAIESVITKKTNEIKVIFFNNLLPMTVIFSVVILTNIMIFNLVSLDSIVMMLFFLFIFIFFNKMFSMSKALSQSELIKSKETSYEKKEKLCSMINENIETLNDVEYFDLMLIEMERNEIEVNKAIKNSLNQKKQNLLDEFKYDSFEQFKKEKILNERNKNKELIENF